MNGDRQFPSGSRRLRRGALVVALLLGVVGLPGVGAADSHCDTTLAPGDSIRTATDNASSGEIICLEAGTYDEGSASWEIDTPLTLEGLAGSDEVTIDRSGASGTRGVVISGDDVTLRGFTLLGPRPPTGVEYGIKIEFVSGLLVDDVVVRESGRSGIDLHGVDGATFTDVGSHDNSPGVGFAVTDSHNVDVSGLATSGNAWGGMAIFTSGKFTVPAGVSNISVADSSFSGEPAAGLYLQDSGTTGPSGFQGISITGNTFSENGTQFAQIDENGDLADLGVDTLGVLQDNSFDRAVVTGSEDPAAVTVPAIFSAIQDGVDAADPGDAVFVLSGLYEEEVLVETDDLRLRGFGAEVLGSVHVTDAVSQVAMSGFSVENVAGSEEEGTFDSSPHGVALLVEAPVADVRDNAFVGNEPRAGYAQPATVTFLNTEELGFHGNVVDGIDDQDRDPNGVFVSAAQDAGELLFTNNEIVGAAAGGIGLLGPATGSVRLENNVLSENGDGAWFAGPGFGGTDVVPVLRYNDIAGNDRGLLAVDGVSVDAQGNWWGSPAGPDHPDNPVPSPVAGDSIEGDAEFFPWCALSGCPVLQGLGIP